jgi:hypothetical protein
MVHARTRTVVSDPVLRGVTLRATTVECVFPKLQHTFEWLLAHVRHPPVGASGPVPKIKILNLLAPR